MRRGVAYTRIPERVWRYQTKQLREIGKIRRSYLVVSWPWLTCLQAPFALTVAPPHRASQNTGVFWFDGTRIEMGDLRPVRRSTLCNLWQPRRRDHSSCVRNDETNVLLYRYTARRYLSLWKMSDEQMSNIQDTPFTTYPLSERGNVQIHAWRFRRLPGGFN